MYRGASGSHELRVSIIMSIRASTPFILVFLLCVILMGLHTMSNLISINPREIPAAAYNEKRAELVPNSCLPSETMKQFDKIYDTAVWGGYIQEKENFYSNANWPPKERISASGTGSYLGYNTNTSLDVIRKTISKYNVTAMIDLPCGDVNWIFDSWETDSLELYIGLDVVSAVISRNKERLKHHINKVFEHWD